MVPADPKYHLASEHFQRGLKALESRQIPEALRWFNRAEQSGYSSDECASGRWDCWMLLGEFERAWQESDGIAGRGGDADRLWNHQPFDRKHLMIRCLHGLGDAIQFIRYAQLLRPRTSAITVETHGSLVPLFGQLPYIDQVVTWEDGSSKSICDWDQQIEVMELSRAFRTVCETIPANIPYLVVGAEQRERSRIALGGRPECKKVGLVWASSEWNPERSLPISSLFPLTHIAGLELFSFQRGPRAIDLEILRLHKHVVATADRSPGIADTAADLTNMDLLITVDTMAAHLAGALGVLVWLLLPFQADWRWMLDREDTPWYPTVTLFRQSAPGDWRSVIERVVARLDDFT